MPQRATAAAPASSAKSPNFDEPLTDAQIAAWEFRAEATDERKQTPHGQADMESENQARQGAGLGGD